MSQAELAAQLKEAEAQQTAYESDLIAALPALQAAVDAVDSLSIGASLIQELGHLRQPPPPLEPVAKAVLTALGETAPSWEKFRQQCGNRDAFIMKLRGVDKDNLHPAVASRLQTYVSNPNFTPEHVKPVSMAGEILCRWVCSLHTYHLIAQQIAPKRHALQAVRERIAQLKQQLEIAQA